MYLDLREQLAAVRGAGRLFAASAPNRGPRLITRPVPIVSRNATTASSTLNGLMTKNDSSTRFAGLAADSGGESDDRPPVVLLHGLSFDRTMWRPALRELEHVDPGRRVLAIDLPGHGQSNHTGAYDIEQVAGAVHEAVAAAQLGAPIVVGHSMSAGIAAIYATTYPARGVVNVDQPLQIAPFAHLVKSLATKIRGPEFPAVWEQFAASFHTELLPPAAQELVRSTCDPRQELIAGYWRAVMDDPVEDTVDLVTRTVASMRAAKLPCVVVAGDELDAEYRDWLTGVLPQVEIVVWPRSSHFPNLAHPDRFARVLADTARWPAASHTGSP